MITKQEYAEYLKYSRRHSGDDAEDVLQNALLRAWRFKNKQTGSFQGWLRTIIRNESYRRFERKQFDYVDLDLSDIPAVNKQDDRIDLTSCLKSLDNKKLKLMCCKLAGLSAEETSEITGFGKNNVMTIWKRSTDQMKAYYKGA